MKKNNKLVTILLASSLLLPGIAPLATGVTSVAAATETVATAKQVDAQYVTVVDQVLRNVRSDQAVSNGFVPAGKTVTNVRDAGKGWFQVDYDGNTGYIQRSEVTSVENYENMGQGDIHNVPAPKESKRDAKYIVAVTTGLRTKDVDVYRPLRMLKSGEEVEYLGTTTNGWFKVKDKNGVEGYVNTGDVTSVKNYNDTSTPELHDVETTNETKREGKHELLLTSSIRTKDNRAYRVIAELQRGDVVTYLGTTDNDWFKVKTEDGKIGFIYRGDVTAVEEEEALVIDSVSPINTKTLEVTFNKAVTDTDAAAFEVLKGTSTNISVSSKTWNEDKTVAQLTLASKISEGKYTVNVSGLTEEVLTGSVDTLNEKVDKVEILSDLAVISGNDLTVGYKVLNQYGEDITSKVSTSDLTPSATNGTATVTLNPATSIATIDNSTSDLKADAKVTLTIVHNATGTVATKQLTVSATAGVAEVAFGDLYNEDGLELSEDNTAEKFYVKVNVKDQYGNALKAANLTSSDVVLTSSRTDVLAAHSTPFKEIKIDGKDVTVLELNALAMTEGTANFTLVSLFNGKTATKALTVKAATKADTISLSQPDLAVADEIVVIPFDAVDNYGETVTSLSKLTGVTVVPTAGTGLAGTAPTASFKKNASTGNVELLLTLTGVTGKGKVTLVATTPTGKVATLSVDVKEAAKPVAITGLKDINLNHVAGKNVTITTGNLVFADQYDRIMKNSAINLSKDPTAAGEYSVKVESSDTTVATVTTSPLISGTPVTLDGQVKGNTDVTFTIRGWNGSAAADLAGSDFTTTVRIAEQTEFVSYEAGKVETVYDDSTALIANDAYVSELKVYGVLANGTKVLLPETAYNVVLTGQSGIDANAGTNAWDIDVEAIGTAGGSEVSPINYATNATEATVKATITINATGENIEKDITISKKAPTVANIALDSSIVKGGYDLASFTQLSNGATTATNKDISDLIDSSKSLDSYGEPVTFTSGTATFANGSTAKVFYTISDILDIAPKTLTITGNGTEAIDVNTISAGDSFKVTVKANNVTASFNAVK